jgi:hypothetical protein
MENTPGRIFNRKASSGDSRERRAWAVSRANLTYLSALYHRVARRRAKKKAAVAVCHAILVMAHHILKNRVPYQESGADYFDFLNASHVKNHFVHRLESLEFKLAAEPLSIN